MVQDGVAGSQAREKTGRPTGISTEPVARTAAYGFNGALSPYRYRLGSEVERNIGLREQFAGSGLGRGTEV